MMRFTYTQANWDLTGIYAASTLTAARKHIALF